MSTRPVEELISAIQSVQDWNDTYVGECIAAVEADLILGPRPTLNAFRNLCHNAAIEKGWYNPPPAEMEAKFVANVHGEVSEFWEAHRKGTLDQPCDKPCGLTCREEEMADILIRVFDMAGRWNVDLDKAVEAKLAYNRTRPARHGGKVA